MKSGQEGRNARRCRRVAPHPSRSTGSMQRRIHRPAGAARTRAGTREPGTPGRPGAAVPPGAPVNDRPVTQRGAAAEPAATAVVRAPAVLPRAEAPARPGTGRRRRAPDRQVAASPGPVVQGSTVETQQRPDTERNRDCPACPRSPRFASWTNRPCASRRSTTELGALCQAWAELVRSSLVVPGRDYPVRQADWITNQPLPRARAARRLVTRGPWSLMRSSCRAGECCARVRCHAGRCHAGR